MSVQPRPSVAEASPYRTTLSMISPIAKAGPDDVGPT